MITRTQLAMGQVIGMSPDAKERLSEVNEAALWRASCRKCKLTLKGTLAQMREHRCENG